MPGDQVARDHEEDIDADEAAGQARGAEMEGDDAQHRERAQALDIRAERFRCRDGAHKFGSRFSFGKPPRVRIGR